MVLNSNLQIPLKETILNEEKSSFDIANPSFTINNKKGKISVKAKKGKFLNKNLIRLAKIKTSRQHLILMNGGFVC